LQHSSNSCKYCVSLHPWVMMLIIVATPCYYMACHVIIMGDWVINCKGQWYFWLPNKWNFIKISIISHDVDYNCNTLLSNGMPFHQHERLSCYYKGQCYFWLNNFTSQIYINTHLNGILPQKPTSCHIGPIVAKPWCHVPCWCFLLLLNDVYD
jgi:hypothetical protein